MGEYGFDPSWTNEQRRLALIEHSYDPFTIARLEQLGVAPGWRCLDVGAGGGSIARWLRDRVGPEGSVVALDVDTRFLEDEPGIEARRADILTDELEQGAYDLVHCRLLLHHLRGRQLEAVERMAAALRPGGVLMAAEGFGGGIRLSPTPAVAAAWGGVEEVIANADYGWAPRLPGTLQAAGLVDVDAAGHVDVVRGGSPEAEFACLTFEAVRERVSGDVDIDGAIERLRDPSAVEPGLVWYTAWGRRAGA